MDGNRSFTFLAPRYHRACTDDLCVSAIAPNPSDFLNRLSSRPPVFRRLSVLERPGNVPCELPAVPASPWRGAASLAPDPLFVRGRPMRRDRAGLAPLASAGGPDRPPLPRLDRSFAGCGKP